MTSDLTQTFKVNRSKLKVMAWHDVLASENRYISWRDSLTEFKVCANCPKASRNTWYRLKVIRLKYQIAITPPRIALKFGTNISVMFHWKYSRQANNASQVWNAYIERLVPPGSTEPIGLLLDDGLSCFLQSSTESTQVEPFRVVYMAKVTKWLRAEVNKIKFVFDHLGPNITVEHNNVLKKP